MAAVAATTLIWNVGDGHDTTDGGAGADTLELFCTVENETIFLIPFSGDALRVVVDGVNVDADNVETVIVHALGGFDRISFSQDLSATDVAQLTVNLEGTIGSGTGDGAADEVLVTLSGAIHITGAGTSIAVSSPSLSIAMSAVEAGDRLIVSGTQSQRHRSPRPASAFRSCDACT